jgi:hypothetical protein
MMATGLIGDDEGIAKSAIRYHQAKTGPKEVKGPNRRATGPLSGEFDIGSVPS